MPWDLITERARAYQLDPVLVAAIVQVESSGNPYVTRYEPDFKWTVDPRGWALKLGYGMTERSELEAQKTSWGLMQVMGANARDNGFARFLPELVQPKVGIEFGCRWLKRQFTRYNGRLFEVVSAYNAGREMCDGDVCTNHYYVMRVMELLGKGM